MDDERANGYGEYRDMLYSVEGACCTIVLNRPEVRNALGQPQLKELASALVRADTDDSVKVVVLTGNGPAFCAGADLRGSPAATEK
jgi:enoyl-CoA hydratase/carnithine racemase